MEIGSPGSDARRPGHLPRSTCPPAVNRDREAPACPKKAGTDGRSQARRHPGGTGVPAGTREATADDVETSPFVTVPDSQTTICSPLPGPLETPGAPQPANTATTNSPAAPAPSGLDGRRRRRRSLRRRPIEPAPSRRHRPRGDVLDRRATDRSLSCPEMQTTGTRHHCAWCWGRFRLAPRRS